MSGQRTEKPTAGATGVENELAVQDQPWRRRPRQDGEAHEGTSQGGLGTCRPGGDIHPASGAPPATPASSHMRHERASGLHLDLHRDEVRDRVRAITELKIPDMWWFGMQPYTQENPPPKVLSCVFVFFTFLLLCQSDI